MEIELYEGINHIDIEDDRYIVIADVMVDLEHELYWVGDRESPPEYNTEENIIIRDVEVWDKLKEEYVELDIKWKVG